MRIQTFGDKQREAQQRKKKEELWAKTHPKDSDKPEEAKKEPEKADKPKRRSA